MVKRIGGQFDKSETCATCEHWNIRYEQGGTAQCGVLHRPFKDYISTSSDNKCDRWKRRDPKANVTPLEQWDYYG